MHKSLFYAYFSTLLSVVMVQEDKARTLYLAERYKKIQETFSCSTNSPIQDLQYGLKKVTEIKEITFCDEYAKRSCCSEENFTDVKRKWFRDYNIALNISPQCQEIYQKLVCYDCDGDIGVNIRRGLCPSLCSNLYKSCYQDIFAFDEKQTNRVRFCRGNDIVCSELRYMFKDGDSFCQALGFEVNQNTNFDEWLDDLVMNSTKKNPACWDGTPSQRIFGPAYDLTKAAFSKNREKSAQEAREKEKAASDNSTQALNQTKEGKKLTDSGSNYWFVYVLVGLAIVVAVIIVGNMLKKQKKRR